MERRPMGLLDSIRGDSKAARQRDPAATSDLEVVLTYPGFHARQIHRLAHSLHGRGMRVPARVVARRARACTGIEIHPGARSGEGRAPDHALGFGAPGDDTVLRLPEPEWDIIKSRESRIAELESRSAELGSGKTQKKTAVSVDGEDEIT